MKILSTQQEVLAIVSDWKSLNKTIGFVPTMGALHQGHLALISKAVAENDICIVSIFVNPTQFNNSTDLEKYPRDLNKDIKLLESVGCNFVFAPESKEVYTIEELNGTFSFDFGGLDTVMEGKFRPGHFNGVVQIVSKLFQLINPDKAYFGEKDFQQLAIIHRMVKLMKFGTQIIDCPIVREESGLAMSSRNERLTDSQRKNAAAISAILVKSTTFVPHLTPKQLTDWVVSQINSAIDLEIEYFEIADAETLQTAQNWDKPTVGCIAVFCGNVRLIDNIRYKKN